MLDLKNTPALPEGLGHPIKGTGRTGFDVAVREAVADDALTRELMDATLGAQAMLWKLNTWRRSWSPIRGLAALHGDAERGSGDRLNFVTAIDIARFRRSRDTGGLLRADLATAAVLHIDRRRRDASARPAMEMFRALWERASALVTSFKGRDKVRR